MRDSARVLPTCGAVAQLGERLNGIQEVEGSTPFGSTLPYLAFPGRYYSPAPHSAPAPHQTASAADRYRTVSVLAAGRRTGFTTGSGPRYSLAFLPARRRSSSEMM